MYMLHGRWSKQVKSDIFYLIYAFFIFYFTLFYYFIISFTYEEKKQDYDNGNNYLIVLC